MVAEPLPNRWKASLPEVRLTALAEAKSTKQVTELLERYARGAGEAATDAQGGGLLGGKPATRGGDFGEGGGQG